MKAVVFAGGHASPALSAVAGESRKALMVIGGRHAASYVLEALLHADDVEECVLVAAPECKRLAGEGLFLEEGSGAIDNILRGMAALGAQDEERVLVVPGDLPLLRAADVTAFLKSAPEEAGVGGSFVARQAIEQEHPGAKYGFIRLREGEFSTGNLSLLRVATARRLAEELDALHRSRKSQLRTALKLGLGALVAFKLGLLSVRSAKTKVERLVGDVAHADLTASPRTSLDIDDPEDFLYLNRHWERLRAIGAKQDAGD